MGWLAGAFCLGLLGISLLVGVGKWWKTPLSGFCFLVSSSLNKLCLSGPMHFLAFPVLSHVSPLWEVREQGGYRISICCLGLSHYKVHYHSNISFCICNDVILNMISEETHHLQLCHYLSIHVGISSPKLDLEKQLYSFMLVGEGS